MAIASMLASMSDWCTPSILFCFLNLMIATIFVASNFKSPNHHQQYNTPTQLVRSPSLLERVKSIDLSYFYTTPESHDQYKVHSETTEYNSASQHSPRPSLLQRVKSIDFSFSSFHNSFPTEPDQPAASNSPTELNRNLSLLDRVKSFKLTSPFNSDQQSGYTSSSKDSVEDNTVTSAESHNDNLVNLLVKSSVTPANRSSSKLSKKKVAASDRDKEDDERKRFMTKKAVVRVHDESVDAKADDFIKRFKQQLKLQRLDSIQGLREMLNRRTSSVE